jgi:hypothetical protein
MLFQRKDCRQGVSNSIGTEYNGGPVETGSAKFERTESELSGDEEFSKYQHG